MNNNDNMEGLDKMLNDSLGTNEITPDFDKFCKDYSGAVEKLKKNKSLNTPLFSDILASPFSFLKQMFRPMRIPIGICLFLLLIALKGLGVFGSFDSSCVWASVGLKMETVQQVRFYKFAFQDDVPRNKLPDDFIKGYYHKGQVESIYSDGTRLIDDGQKCFIMDLDGKIKFQTKSEYKGIVKTHNMNNLFEVLTKGILEYKQSQIDKQEPVSIGDDFLIYSFLPSGTFESWLESIVITVAKKSLLPLQMKLQYKNKPGRKDIYFFEYPVNGKKIPNLKVAPKTAKIEGKWHGHWENEWGYEEELTVEISSADNNRCQIIVYDPDDEYAYEQMRINCELVNGNKFVFENNEVIEEGQGVFDGELIKGHFKGSESGTFELRAVKE